MLYFWYCWDAKLPIYESNFSPQIWSNIEAGQYLQATQLYLLARHVHTGLQLDAQLAAKIQQWFPLLTRQWAAISHFRGTLLQVWKWCHQMVTIISHESSITHSVQDWVSGWTFFANNRARVRVTRNRVAQSQSGREDSCKSSITLWPRLAAYLPFRFTRWPDQEILGGRTVSTEIEGKVGPWYCKSNPVSVFQMTLYPTISW